jgi:transketolase
LADADENRSLARRVRQLILDESHRAHVGHIGSALSVVEILAVLYGNVLDSRPSDPAGPDRFILSKGHAALALYAVLSTAGVITQDQLASYCGDGSLLGVHPDHALPGIDFSTGSLGHGLPIGVGSALAARLQASRRRTFVLVSDAECNEGSLWEAVMLAAHLRLASLVAIVDCNGRQALGRTDQILDLSPLAERWRAFGWDTHEVDGHDTEALGAILRALDMDEGPPHAVIAHTVLGKGVSFMQGDFRWHYLPMSADEYARACRELTGDAP